MDIQMLKERLLKLLFLLCAFIGVFGVAIIFVFVTVKGAPIFKTVGPLEFLTATDWAPTEGYFGILPLIIGSLLVTLGALVLGAPLALATAIYLSEIATKKVRAVVRPAIELLAGIPSVIYGFFGIMVITPFVRRFIGGSGYSVFTGSLVLAIMILPTIAAISQDALQAVPRAQKMASMGLGATHWQTITKITLPSASQGLITAVIFGIGRAIGETMAVLMVLGNAPVIPSALNKPMSTLTSVIALDMSYASGDHQTALFAMGIVLLFISMSLIGFIRVFSARRGL